ncbi:MAG: FHA domain-containing protein [Chloroflexota bacterium]
MAVKLTILRGPNSGKIYEFDDDIITIGTGRNNTLVIRDNDVSVEHCRLVRIDSDYDIEDLESRYGTFVNGQPLQEDTWMLRSGSIIELGSQVTIEYRQTPGDETEVRPMLMIDDDPGSQPCLVLVEDAHIEEAYLLRSSEITLGRAAGNDIVIPRNDISRTHIKLSWHDHSYFIEDLESRNGTFLNGVAVTDKLKLHHSDIIRLGSSTQLHFVYRSDLPPEWDPVLPDRGQARTHNTETVPFLQLKRDGTRELTGNLSEGQLNDHILIAYAREDWEDIVATIVLNLDDAKQKVWVDQHLRPESDPWRAAMEHAQLECWLLVVVVSPHAMKTPYIKDTYRYFYNREKPIIVVEYNNIPKTPFELSQMPRITYDKDSPGKMFRRLLYEIMQLKPRHYKE